MTNPDRARADTLRLGLIGAGWITPAHLAALDRLGRARLVAVASAVFWTYADALRTDALTRAVVAATGRGG